MEKFSPQQAITVKDGYINKFTVRQSWCCYDVKYTEMFVKLITFDVKFTRRHIITKAALILCIVIQLDVMDQQAMNCPIDHHLILFTIWLDFLTVLLPRQLNVVLGHGA